MTRPASLQSLTRRVMKLESDQAKPKEQIELVKDYIRFCFDKARWEIVAPTATFDREARREQLGFLHAMITIWEKLGEETPDDVGNMVLALSGRKVIDDAPVTDIN